ncbi:MAG: restriction endonuclease [Clostridium sp.]|nr:restriction endonuclease [Clostridium sp.]
MSPYTKLFLYTVILIALNLTNKYLIPSEDDVCNKFKDHRLMYGLTSRYFLSKLSNYEFENFCSYFLIKKGYSNVDIISESFNGGVSMTCIGSDFKKIYVSCIKSTNKESNNDDNYENVGSPELQKLIGAMVHDKIFNGIVITNGNFSNGAYRYINQLSNKYNIKLIDGINLSKDSWEIRKKNIADLSLIDILS